MLREVGRSGEGKEVEGGIEQAFVLQVLVDWVWRVMNDYYTRFKIGYASSTLSGHKGTIRKIATSPDGKLAASASGDHTLRLVNEGYGTFNNGRVKQNVVQFQRSFQKANQAMAMDMWYCCTEASFDKTIRIWDTQGKPIAVLHGHTQVIHCCDWSPSGNQIMSAGADFDVRVWELQGDTWETVQPPDGSCVELVFWMVSTTILKVLKAKSPREIDDDLGRLFFTLSVVLVSLRDTVGGERAISTSHDGELKLWKIGRNDGTVADEMVSSSKLIAAPSSMIAAGTEAAVCFLLQAPDLGILWRVDVGTAYVTEVAFTTLVEDEEKEEYRCYLHLVLRIIGVAEAKRTARSKCCSKMVCFARIDCETILCGCINNSLQIYVPEIPGKGLQSRVSGAELQEKPGPL
eukprot:763843-Hanusia_phi.AAC.1